MCKNEHRSLSAGVCENMSVEDTVCMCNGGVCGEYGSVCKRVHKRDCACVCV